MTEYDNLKQELKSLKIKTLNRIVPFGKYKVAGNFKTDSNCFWTDKFYIPASKEIKKKLFKAIKEAGYNWNSKTLELEKIEKVKFKPFDKVLVRDNKNENWSASFFSHYIPSSLWPFRCFNVGYSYCIPYEGNEHLVGTNKDK